MTTSEAVLQLEAMLLPFHDEGWRADLAALGESAREASRTFAEHVQRLARLATAVPPPGVERGATAWTSFVREVAAARRVTDRAAGTDVEIAVQLVGRMPCVLSLLREGRLPVAQARTLAQETAHCDDGVVTQLDEELALRACSLATWRVRDAVQKRLLALDATTAARRAARASAPLRPGCLLRRAHRSNRTGWRRARPDARTCDLSDRARSGGHPFG